MVKNYFIKMIDSKHEKNTLLSIQNYLSLLMLVYFFTLTADTFASKSRFESGVSLDLILDNYSYGNKYPETFRDRSVLLTHVKPEFGVRLNGNHKIRSGLSCFYERNTATEPQPREIDISISSGLMLYYHYDAEHLQLRLGWFPYAGTIDVPVWFFSKELINSRRLVNRGAAVEVNHGDITAAAWLNGFGAAEQFSYGARLGYNPQGIFFARGDFMMTHYHTNLLMPTGGLDLMRYILNNGGISIEAGAAWSQIAFLDTLTVSGGQIIALDREKGENLWYTPADGKDNVWYTPAGGFINAFAATEMFGARGFLYVGEPLRQRHGRDQWARFWRYNWDGPVTYSRIETYMRLDLLLRYPIKENVRAEFTQAFHILNIRNDSAINAFNGTAPVGYSQHFLLQAEFGGASNKEKKREMKKLR